VITRVLKMCSRSVLLYNGVSFLRIRRTYFPVRPFTRCKQIALSTRMFLNVIVLWGVKYIPSWRISCFAGSKGHIVQQH
jgi:hypothetical protein